MNKKINFLASLCNTNINGAIHICENYLEAKFDSTFRYLYKDNKSNILAVAHLDTVEDHYKTKITTPKLLTDGNMVNSINLDDRLGVAIILQHLKQENIIPDILLTTDEEIGRSSASNFLSNKEYNWVFEFDRRGSDVVLYDYQDEYSESVARNSGYNIEIGLFSDICSLDLGVKAFNFGCGYHYEHTLNCTAKMPTVDKIVRKFSQFYHLNKDVKMPHDSSMNDYSYLYKEYDQKFDYKYWSSQTAKCSICNLTYDLTLVYPQERYYFCEDCCDLYSWDFHKMKEFCDYMDDDHYVDQ